MKWNVLTLILAVTISGIMMAANAPDAQGLGSVEELKTKNKLLSKAVADLGDEINGLRDEISDLRDMDVSSRQLDTLGNAAAATSTLTSNLPTTGKTPDPTAPIPKGTTVEDILSNAEQREALQSQVFAWIDNRNKTAAREDLQDYLRMIEEKRKNKYFKQFKLTDDVKDEWNKILADHYKLIESLNAEKYDGYDGNSEVDLRGVQKKLHQANMKKMKDLKGLLPPDQAKKFSKDLRSSSKMYSDPASMYNLLNNMSK